MVDSEKDWVPDDDATGAAGATTTAASSSSADLDASEAESIRLARADLQEKMASRDGPAPDDHAAPTEDPVTTKKENEGKDNIQMERCGQRSSAIKMETAESPPSMMTTKTELGDSHSAAEAHQSTATRGLRRTPEEWDAKKEALDMDDPAGSIMDLPTTSTATPQPVLGAVSVMNDSSTNSQNVQQLYPIHPTSFNSREDSDVENQQQRNSNTTNATSNSPPSDAPLLEATLVEHHSQDEDDVATATPAKVVSAEELVCGFSTQQLWYLGCCLTILVAAIVVAVTLLVLGDDSISPTTAPTVAVTSSPTPVPLPTLQQIRDRDVVRCGVWKESLEFFNFAKIYESQQDQVDFVLCEAYAAAVLGNATKHEIVLTSQDDNLQDLAEGKIDILLSHVQTGMQEDVWEYKLGLDQGFSFSTPYVMTDLVFGGLPEYVACADDNMNARGNCSGLKICTNDNSFYFETIAGHLPESHLVKRNDTLAIVMGFIMGECNVIPSENSGIMEWGLKILSYTGDYSRGTLPFAKDVVTVATSEDDVEWADFVNLIVLGLMAAEDANITKENAERMAESAVLGEELVHAVRAVGSYKDVYERGISPVMPRGTWNRINNGTTGLLYSLPLGKVKTIGPGAREGGTLEQIWMRQDRKLHCGIRPNRPGFASEDENGIPVGMDIEYCTALAASALEGEAQSIEFVPVEDEEDGYKKLQAGEVDVLAGFTWNVINDYKEPTTGEGYSFSQPYFYRPPDDISSNSTGLLLGEGDNLCLVTRQDDVQFSSFVYWTVASTFIASEQGISTATANMMTDINLFGDDYVKMFRDAIYFAGSYDEIYERNLGDLLPNRDRNAVNNIRNPGPQLYVPPGFLSTSFHRM